MLNYIINHSEINNLFSYVIIYKKDIINYVEYTINSFHSNLNIYA